MKLPAGVAAREVASREALREVLGEAVQARYAAREAELSTDLLRTLERWVMLHVIDSQWKDHLLSMDHMKEGIGLRGYGQRDPLTEYKREAYDLFEEMVDRVRTSVTELLFKMQVARDAAPRARAPPGRRRAVRARSSAVCAVARARPSGGPRRRGAGRRSAGTIPATAAPGRSTRSAVSPREREGSSLHRLSLGRAAARARARRINM